MRPTLLLTALALTLSACGGDGGGDASTPTFDAATDTGGSTDAGTSDAADATADDANAGTDAVACIRPSLECAGPCRLDFFGASRDRDNVRTVEILHVQNAAMSVVDVRIVEGGSPYVRLSDSWYNYVDRAGLGTWQPSENGLGFDAPGTPIPIGPDESFVVDVAFDEHDDTGPLCPDNDDRNCAELIVSFDDCNGGTVDLEIPIQI